MQHVLEEISIVYEKVKTGGILGGHDYDQIGVMAAAQTFMINLWRFNKEKPKNFFVESCRDNHPGYPSEYLEFGFPLDWWITKEKDLGPEFEILNLRNG